jgi:putative hydrolase of the HAD superfamily
MPIRAIIFDRDGVLVDFDLKAAAAFFEPLLPISLPELAERWDQWGEAVGFPSSLAEERAFFQKFWDHIDLEFGLSQSTLKQLHQADYTNYLLPFPDARPVLVEARKRGLRIGVLSNFGLASLEASLEATGLRDLVDVVCAATVIGVAKPYPEAYLTAIRALCVEPEACLFFDDEKEHIEGGRTVGLHAYLVDRGRSGHGLSEGVVRDLTALSDILAREVAI